MISGRPNHTIANMKQSLFHGVFWHHLIYPEFSTHEVEEPELSIAGMHQALMRGRFPHFVVCLAIDDYDDLPTEERREALESVRGCIRRMLPASQRMLMGFAHGNSVYFCGMLPDGEPSDRAREAIAERLESLQAIISGVLAQSITIGLAFLSESSLGAWRGATQRAVVAQRSKVRFGSGRMYTAGDDFHPPTLDFRGYWSLANRLHELVRSGSVSRAGQAIDDVLRTLFDETYLPLRHLRPVLQSQIILMAQAAAEVGVDAASVARQSEESLEQLGVTFDYEQMKDLIRGAVISFTTAVHDRHRYQSGRLAAQADEHIDAHLTDPDLGLQQIASALGASPSYLSRCYKKATGEGVVESINRRRINEARRLLLDSRLTITEIAFQLGFGSVQHFGRVFRCQEGSTPSGFRRQK